MEKLQIMDKITPMILIFDDAHNMDYFSFKMIRLLIKSFSRLCIVFLYRDNNYEIESNYTNETKYNHI